MAKIYSCKTPKKSTAEFQRLCDKADLLVQRNLYRRAAEVWGKSVTTSGLTEQERDLCVQNAASCSAQARYTGKPED